jgi:hypothetical protein
VYTLERDPKTFVEVSDESSEKLFLTYILRPVMAVMPSSKILGLHVYDIQLLIRFLCEFHETIVFPMKSSSQDPENPAISVIAMQAMSN